MSVSARRFYNLVPDSPQDSLFRGERMHGKALGCWGIRAKTYILDMVEAKRGSPASVLQGLSGEGLIVAVDKAADQEEELAARTCGLTGHCMSLHGPQHSLCGLHAPRESILLPSIPGHGQQAHLNWQKMSAYSAEMLDACRTVTRKVKVLPRRRWSRAVSRGPSRADFSGLSRRPSGGTAVGSQSRAWGL